MNNLKIGIGLSVLLFFWACGRKDVDRHGNIKLRGERPVTVEDRGGGDLIQRGIASWYGYPFHGRRTANGEIYDMRQRTAAHKTLPFGTQVEVVNMDNGRRTVVRINDRGPFVRGRVIDLSEKAAQDIGMIGPGTATVNLYLISRATDTGTRTVHVEPSRDGYWRVQVGSFSELQRARAMALRMETFSTEVSVSRFKKMFRVRVGQYTTKQDAVFLAERLFANEIDSWIVFEEK